VSAAASLPWGCIAPHDRSAAPCGQDCWLAQEDTGDPDRPVSAPYLGAGEFADICGVDLKTIHNWVRLHGVPHFYTPGRHLRFKAKEIVPWLRRQGFDVPAKLAHAGGAS